MATEFDDIQDQILNGLIALELNPDDLLLMADRGKEVPLTIQLEAIN